MRTKREKRSQFRDRNRQLTPSARNLILTLAERIDEGEGFAGNYLKSEYASKLCAPGLTTAEDRRQNAIDKFVETELRNYTTNHRLRNLAPGYNILPRVSLEAFLRVARHHVAGVLGQISDEVVLGRFSAGATTSRGRSEGHPSFKFTGKVDVTREAEIYTILLDGYSSVLRHLTDFHDRRVVAGNQLFTVPKKTDIDRCACKEPDINVYLQRGVGRYIAHRLRKVGINLTDQSINRGLARQGSLSGTLATLDLSAASDSLTIECVRLLLPDDWFSLLNDLRSHNCQVAGRYFRLEMFSSMGNGFTFELESLIFWALGRTVAHFEGYESEISVYGDDIICPSGMYDMLTFVLGIFGFKPNHDKSFSTGLFRESCGGHYYVGEDVTPFYLKREPKRLTDLIRIANRLRRWLLESNGYRQWDQPRLASLWLELREEVPRELWGGSDYDLDTQLVTPPILGKMVRLVRINEDGKRNERGAYVQWQNDNRNRGLDPEGGEEKLVRTNQKCRYKPAKPSAFHGRDWLYDELDPNSGHLL